MAKDGNKSQWKEFFWNPRTREFCGRTASSWGKNRFPPPCRNHQASFTPYVRFSCILLFILHWIVISPLSPQTSVHCDFQTKQHTQCFRAELNPSQTVGCRAMDLWGLAPDYCSPAYILHGTSSWYWIKCQSYTGIHSPVRMGAVNEKIRMKVGSGSFPGDRQPRKTLPEWLKTVEDFSWRAAATLAFIEGDN